MQIKSRMLLLCLFVCGLFIAGCETAKGAVMGVRGTAEGLVKDTTNVCVGTWEAAQTADNWMRENLW